MDQNLARLAQIKSGLTAPTLQHSPKAPLILNIAQYDWFVLRFFCLCIYLFSLHWIGVYLNKNQLCCSLYSIAWQLHEFIAFASH